MRVLLQRRLMELLSEPLFSLDDLMPSLFDKPLLTDQPNVSQSAWH
jgi:hypothetical protein